MTVKLKLSLKLPFLLSSLSKVEVLSRYCPMTGMVSTKNTVLLRVAFELWLALASNIVTLYQPARMPLVLIVQL